MARKILHIDSSARGGQSDSARLSGEFIRRWRETFPQEEIVSRNLTQDPIPHLDEATLGGLYTPEEQRSESQKAAVSRVDWLVEEFLEADVVILGVLMYNFGIPSVLKAYIDHIAQAGRTFHYTENGPEGLAGGKTVYILSTRGGVYQDSPLDHQVAYLRTVFGFLGIDDIQVIQAEGMSLGGDTREINLRQAGQAIEAAIREEAGELRVA